jgi:hypothetical protein
MTDLIIHQGTGINHSTASFGKSFLSQQHLPNVRMDNDGIGCMGGIDIPLRCSVGDEEGGRGRVRERDRKALLFLEY